MRNHPVLRRAASARGQTFVEFALIALPLCLMILAIAQLGFYFQAKSTLRDAVRAAARQASLCRATNGSSQSPVQIYRGIVSNSLSSAPDPTITPGISTGCTGTPPGTKVTVTGSYDFTVNIAGWVVIPASELTSTAVTIVE